MSILPDHEIRDYSSEHGLIDPFNEDQLQPASYDVRLDDKILVPHLRLHHPIDLATPSEDRMDEVDISEGFWLQPHQFVLGSTVERVVIPDYMVGRIEGKSSRARDQIQIHSAGYLDPGFRGNVTLEIVNFGPASVILRSGVLIGQLSFQYLTSTCRRPYSRERNHYQDSVGAVPSRAGH